MGKKKNYVEKELCEKGLCKRKAQGTWAPDGTKESSMEQESVEKSSGSMGT